MSKKTNQKKTIQGSEIDKKQQLKVKKQKKIKDSSQIFNQRKKKQTKNSQQQFNLQEKQLVLSEDDVSNQNLKQMDKKLKKKPSKNNKISKPKTQPKIKIKNKFFADISIDNENLEEQNKNQPKNLIEEQISNQNSKKSIQGSKSQLIIERHKQITQTSNQSKFEKIIQKSDFIRGRYDFKNIENDSKYKLYMKKKLQQVQDVEQVIISELEVPQVHRDKLISSSIYVANSKFKKDFHKKSQNETVKKMTAQEIVMERRMLKNRDYFYRKLNQQIKQQRGFKYKERLCQIKSLQTVNNGIEQNKQHMKLNDDQKTSDSVTMNENNNIDNKTCQQVLTENSDEKI